MFYRHYSNPPEGNYKPHASVPRGHERRFYKTREEVRSPTQKILRMYEHHKRRDIPSCYRGEG
ncbi:hypothetical protein KW805_00740 [Candidatus Pacearchaeota archaeon]|nr:hypothetical protein [Candidatus Pacearchaeota archaeon]